MTQCQGLWFSGVNIFIFQGKKTKKSGVPLCHSLVLDQARCFSELLWVQTERLQANGKSRQWEMATNIFYA